MDGVFRGLSPWLSVSIICGLTLSTVVDANWMYLGISAVSTSVIQDDTCAEVPGLVSPQIEVCKNNPESLLCISDGARLGISECKFQFRNERWNCTTNTNYTVFGDVLRKGTRETAFIYAILSAGVVFATTKSCSAGNLTECSCDMAHYGEHDVDGWKWGGCSDNIQYGLWFSRTFVDAPEVMTHESGRNIRNTMNLHNNEAGRKIAEDAMSLKCRCHGVSGSCAVKTCWRSLPSFREIGDSLKLKYERSVPIARRSKRRPRRKGKTKRRQPIKTDDLIYVHKSPNYCRPNIKKGILGTTGRLCNKTSTGSDSCDLLCCGRGYNTQVVTYVSRCHCKFIWCCHVQCKTCETMIEKHTCK
ncbi:protein Wnt-16-like [Mercenaria mercenaria]|uniref:protein Wnt-16-like n=1 Tax=Mercenaria mercenaria TaxID=6596 RepID=UPI00234EA5DE|nr:protein Wnt-16-like [Mercenaria mercenaria]